MMTGLPYVAASRIGNLQINPSGTDPGELETDTRCPAWWVLDLSPLWGYPDERGQNRVIPGANGRRPYPRRKDETTYEMPMLIGGLTDRSGNPATGAPFEQLRSNIDFLRANVCGPWDGTTTTRTAKLTLPDDSELTAQVQCRITLGAQNGEWIRAVLAVTVPAGGFA